MEWLIQFLMLVDLQPFSFSAPLDIGREEKSLSLKCHYIAMFCSTCANLQILSANKICIKCRSSVKHNIAVLCDVCSATSQCCAACLRKVYKNLANPLYQSRSTGCKSCGGQR